MRAPAFALHASAKEHAIIVAWRKPSIPLSFPGRERFSGGAASGAIQFWQLGRGNRVGDAKRLTEADRLANAAQKSGVICCPIGRIAAAERL